MRRQAGWHSDREEATFRLLRLVDFDENVGFRIVVDVATETGCIQIAHVVDNAGPGPLAVRHAEYGETVPRAGIAFRIHPCRRPDPFRGGRTDLPVREASSRDHRDSRARDRRRDISRSAGDGGPGDDARAHRPGSVSTVTTWPEARRSFSTRSTWWRVSPQARWPLTPARVATPQPPTR